MKKLIAFAAGLAALSSLSSNGQSLSYNLGGNAGYSNTTGNKITFADQGVKLTATAYSYTKGSDNTALEASKLGQFGPGLGVVNNEENNSSPYHQVDNFGQNDYILFVFDTLVDVSSIRITPSPGPFDQDVSYWVGNVSNTNLDNVTYSGLIDRGFSGEQVVMGTLSSNSKDVPINSPSTGINAVLFGAQRGLEKDSNYIDAFKVGNLKATVVPEPSSALLSIAGLLGFCMRRRR